MLNKLFSLEGRVALVTGGSRGIGKMIAAGFVAAGAKVYISSRKAEPCHATARVLSATGGQCIALPQDISTVDGCKALTQQYLAHEKQLDVLVNNAGAAWGADYLDFPEQGWDKVMDLNVKSPFFLTQKLHTLLTANASKTKPGKVITDDAHWSHHFRPNGTLQSIVVSQLKQGTWKIHGQTLCLTLTLRQQATTTECYEIWRWKDHVEYRDNGATVMTGFVRKERR